MFPSRNLLWDKPHCITTLNLKTLETKTSCTLTSSRLIRAVTKSHALMSAQQVIKKKGRAASTQGLSFGI